MLIHEQPPDCNEALGIIPEQPVNCDHPKATEFDSYRVWIGFRPWRKSPRLPGLSLIKRAILKARQYGLLSVRMTQRLIDLSQCWEA